MQTPDTTVLVITMSGPSVYEIMLPANNSLIATAGGGPVVLTIFVQAL
jgi:hypothetical protein